ncbi:hypothetical protein EJ110_NYTH28157 [Nymphaea thermarum]|nr:hypothetical protein EJ110_NYTH28157 [Nymphaea thermarum]
MEDSFGFPNVNRNYIHIQSVEAQCRQRNRLESVTGCSSTGTKRSISNLTEPGVDQAVSPTRLSDKKYSIK